MRDREYPTRANLPALFPTERQVPFRLASKQCVAQMWGCDASAREAFSREAHRAGLTQGLPVATCCATNNRGPSEALRSAHICGVPCWGRAESITSRDELPHQE